MRGNKLKWDPVVVAVMRAATGSHPNIYETPRALELARPGIVLVKEVGLVDVIVVVAMEDRAL